MADIDPPLAQSILINDGAESTDTVNVTISLVANDNVGITGYFLSESSSQPLLSFPGWILAASSSNINISTSFNLSGESTEGTYTRFVYVWFRDEAGNISDTESDFITLNMLDTTAPYSTSVIINDGDASTPSAIVTRSLSAFDDFGLTDDFISESPITPNIDDGAWPSLASPTIAYNANVAYTLSQTDDTKSIYVWFKDVSGNLSSLASDTITLTLPATIDLGSNWMFFGDSETDGRANEPSANSQVIAFRNIWNQTYSDSKSPFVNGFSGRTLQGTYNYYLTRSDRNAATWVHFQESGFQDTSQDTPEEFVAIFDLMVRSIVQATPNVVISTETAYSFEAEAELGRDWMQHNVQMRTKIDELRGESINVYIAEVDRNIKELVSRKRVELGATLGQRSVWSDANDSIGRHRHYTGLGNLMVALSIFDALGYDANGLDLSDIRILKSVLQTSSCVLISLNSSNDVSLTEMPCRNGTLSGAKLGIDIWH